MKEKSLLYTFEALVNSLLREFIELDSIKKNPENKSIEFINTKNETLSIELTFFSILGKHQYGLIHKINNQLVNIEKSLDWVINYSCEQMDQSDETQINSFKARVQQSQKNIQTFLEDLEVNIENDYKKILNFVEAESLLILGHSFHPYPKARDGFTSEDFKNYSPEYRKSFSLAWAIVDEDVMLEKHEKEFSSTWIDSIARDCLGSLEVEKLTKDNKKLIPVHPWQLTHIRNNNFVKELESKNKISFLHRGSEVRWYSTSSIRSIYSKNCKYMLKFSMSLRLTNSIRHLQQVEVDRGIQVSDVFKTKEGIKLQEKWPNFNVLHEPAYAALKNEKGETAIDSIVSCRINPFIDGEEESTVLLATLNQLSPNGSSLLDNYTTRENSSYYLDWFTEFTKVVISPLLDSQANFGIFLGAHQQNIILKLNDGGFPIKLYFRDCQGTGYSEDGFKQYSPYSQELALDNGNILTPELGQKIFCYYLIINTAFDTISHLSRISGEKETNFLQILNKSIRELKENGVKDSSCIDYLLNEQYLWVKGNYKCCLKEINENTMKSPADIYIPMNNPIKGAVKHV